MLNQIRIKYNKDLVISGSIRPDLMFVLPLIGESYYAGGRLM